MNRYQQLEDNVKQTREILDQIPTLLSQGDSPKLLPIVDEQGRELAEKQETNQLVLDQSNRLVPGTVTEWVNITERMEDPEWERQTIEIGSDVLRIDNLIEQIVSMLLMNQLVVRYGILFIKPISWTNPLLIGHYFQSVIYSKQHNLLKLSIDYLKFSSQSPKDY